MKEKSALMGMFVLIFIITVLAWDNKITHPLMTEQAAKYSKLKSYLVNNLKLSDNESKVLDTVLNADAKQKMIRDWLQYGSDQEDRPMCRAANHFHNPLKDWER